MRPPPLRPFESKPIRPLSSYPPLWLPLFVLGGAGMAAMLARFWMQLQWPVPFCVLRKFTGIPCPGCGATRSLLAWSQLDIATAFQFNPLLCIGIVTIGLWLLAACADQFAGTRLLHRIIGQWERLPKGRIAVALLALNWLYLCLALPK